MTFAHDDVSSNAGSNNALQRRYCLLLRMLMWSVLVIASVERSTAQPATPPTGTPPSGAAAASGGIKPYKDVITAQAKSDDGLFTVHRIDEKLFYEIPVKLLGREMLLVTRQAKTPQVGYGGEEVNTEVVRWERKFNRILLRTISYVNIAADSLPIARAVKAANFEEIIASFPLAAYGKDSTTLVIDVSPLFTTDIPILTPSQAMRSQLGIAPGPGGLDASRTYIDYARSYPQNIEVENVVTFNATTAPQNRSSRTASFAMHHSMVLLPEKPMMPRLADNRVGYFSLRKTDYGLDVQKAEQRTYIIRWRLEPKDTAAFLRGELVEPKKPITYYIDPATPTKWRKYLKQGVEDWNEAFAEAGFKNAIRCLEPPTPQEDPEFNPEDVRYSVIRYFPSPIANAYGPNVNDPRSGEIIESDIGWYHNVMSLVNGWYFSQAVADPRSHKMPLPDSLMGELIRFVSAHEVGHTLGFPHNMKASNAYPVDSLRSKAFTEKYGTAPSIMDYARFNYVAQPGDGAAMYPKIGPYDKFALRWGYRPIIGAKTPDDELDTLRAWALATEKDKMLRFGAQQFRDILDPFSQTEDLGDDAVKATTYGVKNIERAMGYLLDAAVKKGEDYDVLQELYSGPFGLIAQWAREMGHVANYPGGVDIVLKVGGQKGEIYTPLPKARQREAVQYLVANAYVVPKMFVRPDVTRLLDAQGSVQRIMDVQRRILTTTLDNAKLLRLMEHEAQLGTEAYTVLDLYNDTQNGLFSELKAARITTDAYRRNLQRAFVEELGAKLVPPPPPILPPGIPPEFAAALRIPDVSKTEIRGLTRNQLENLQASCKAAVGKAADTQTRAHLKELVITIENILNPKKS
jgi:hypothetical protein